MGDVKETGEANESVMIDRTTNEIVSEVETSDKILAEKKTEPGAVPEETGKETLEEKKLVFVFVLGGPGGGKSTQCGRIAKEVGYTHLSSGDLLRQKIQSDTVNGFSRPMIEAMIKEGKSVPPDVTMDILQEAMDKSGNDKFILDGFPRDEEIRSYFEAATKAEPELVLYFECSEEEREKRILGRSQGRVDDNAESMRKRFIYYKENTLPVVDYYRERGLVKQIDAGKSEEEVFETLKSILEPSTTEQAEEAPINIIEELGSKVSLIEL